MSDNGDEENVFGYEAGLLDTVELTQQSVDELQAHGINVSDITKLKAAGIVTVLGVAQTPRKNLAKIKARIHLSNTDTQGLSEAKIEKLKEVSQKMLSITEVYGEFRTGKTQLCHTLCVTTQLPDEQGGASGRVAYIDTEGTFRPDRVRAVADRFGVDSQMALENILCARAWSSEQQCELLLELAVRFVEDRSYKLIIVDSIMNLFRQDYSGRGELSERQQFLARLQKLAEEFNVAVVLTNQVQADPGAAAMFAAASSAKPVGGHVLAHASATRIQLRKGRGDERIAKLQDSPDMPEGEATYCLKSGGWEDT
ncbi:uncharacterized protein CcaverHIS019_0200970 [Cutaneotrichosporon cavernicola]|uniref:Uncharacterized protein n=1 Tax=Cutaneotrichosporon cavernicola TaxID=279322 RepID=A0AA48I6G8_9TREE|nr:uncharacterized protein CcaverHIS019_0200970 [Cutaneotrichosporon cavernicola]BEI88735.1 hypothetical protein CcaverHIS019_0200970 [Cutaneotrichosporon cavernicola]